MTWIEFAGGVGCGKSSLAQALKVQLRLANVPVSEAREAFARHAFGAGETGILQRTAVKAARAYWQARFAASHPALTVAVMQSSRYRRSLPGWHNRLILGLFFEVAGWHECLSRLEAGEVVIADEGLAHRAVNLFAWQPGPIEKRVVDAYLEKLPPVDLTVLVRAPVESCLERASMRGLPIRLRGKDAQTIRRFIENSEAVSERISRGLRARGQPLIEINNQGDLEEAVFELRKSVNALGLFSLEPLVKQAPGGLQPVESKAR